VAGFNTTGMEVFILNSMGSILIPLHSLGANMRNPKGLKSNYTTFVEDLKSVLIFLSRASLKLWINLAVPTVVQYIE
jgi:hypothetical protein